MTSQHSVNCHTEKRSWRGWRGSREGARAPLFLGHSGMAKGSRRRGKSSSESRDRNGVGQRNKEGRGGHFRGWDELEQRPREDKNRWIQKPKSVGNLKNGHAKPAHYGFWFQFISSHTAFSSSWRGLFWCVINRMGGRMGVCAFKGRRERKTPGLVRSPRVTGPASLDQPLRTFLVLPLRPWKMARWVEGR